jgi:hypothetical protein
MVCIGMSSIATRIGVTNIELSLFSVVFLKTIVAGQVKQHIVELLYFFVGRKVLTKNYEVVVVVHIFVEEYKMDRLAMVCTNLFFPDHFYEIIGSMLEWEDVFWREF